MSKVINRAVLTAVLLLSLFSVPAVAQSLPSLHCDTLKALGARYGELNKGDDNQRREFAVIVAETFVARFPGEGWGSKRAANGHPLSKDVVARQRTGIPLDGWDLVDGTTRRVKCDGYVKLSGQVFVPASSKDHLGVPRDPPDPVLPPDPPPVVILPPPSVGLATSDLQAQQIALLLQLVASQKEQTVRLETALIQVGQTLRELQGGGIKVRF